MAMTMEFGSSHCHLPFFFFPMVATPKNCFFLLGMHDHDDDNNNKEEVGNALVTLLSCI
jgi:predicted MPP superfamily phosphohydrolase